MNAATNFKPETANAVFWPSINARSAATSTTVTTAAKNQRIVRFSAVGQDSQSTSKLPADTLVKY
jgi:hypothetical protein